jgi:hypothetical protein
LTGAELRVRAAGLPCAVVYRNGLWRVTVAEVVYADDPVLASAIVEAFGGRIERGDAERLAAVLSERLYVGVTRLSS